MDESGNRVLPASLPLVMVTNARSVFNKAKSLRKWLNEIFPDCAVVSETWNHEGRRVDLQMLLADTPFKEFSYRRPRGKTGGSCSIIYNESRFKVEEVHIQTENGIESVWAMMTPRNLDHRLQHIKRVCVCSVYIAPRSKMKVETMNHIIQGIHIIRSRFDNKVSFVVAGDVNRTDYTDVIDSYGALKQCVTVGTRKDATLEIILSDLLNLYHPPTVIDPLEVDEGKTGKNSDHNIVIFAPRSNPNFKVERKKRTIKTRPIPDSRIPLFGRDIQQQNWQDIFSESNIDEKVVKFHKTIVDICEKHFPVKTIKISNLDQKWLTPELKTLSRKIKKEFFRHRRSQKWKRLKAEFKTKKKVSIQKFHKHFVTELKMSDPGKFYKMCRKIGAISSQSDGELKIKCLEGLSDKECAEAVASHFAAVSNEYEPVDLAALPAFLPALPLPQVEEYMVYEKMKRMKCTKGTHPIDIPSKLRKEVMVELVTPLTHIINTALATGQYPALWKKEYVTPVPKIKEPEMIKDVRKIAGTSD